MREERPGSAAGPAEDPAIWTKFWQYDRVASCMDATADRNYDERTATGWARFFADLPEKSRVLDLCTGNGAVPLIALDASRAVGKSFSITAIDRAAIDPARFVRGRAGDLQQIDFRAGVACEALPFADGSFDAVTSQYGIEYSELRRSFPEALRVLRKGGRVRLVMHAAEGVVSRNAAGGVADVAYLLDEIDLVGSAARCTASVWAVEQGASADVEGAKRLFADFVRALEQAEARLAAATDKGVVRHAIGIARDTYARRRNHPLPNLLAKFEEVRAELHAHQARLDALVRAAVSAADLAGLRQQALADGASDVTLAESRGSANELIGHVFEGVQ